ncbi:FAD:protein FMN transferase [Telmatocola sphagniphila]|uniref:FAD:protein FMN transferase n=1 Tax=Telmatocola sphagniphila TaxID=1123043 RepID=A0A8E6ETW1_9BACT|nr:FAD:protein FMN transferase [Telmatocola sphagniphila]QVL32929.1 FAD:protein FMN transferase [Telmatocola sphagniphila]
MHRRNLFRAAELGDIFSAFGLSEELPPELTLIRASRQAMATLFEIFLPYSLPNSMQAADAAFDLIDEMEDQLTVYRNSSEVSKLNACAASEFIPVAPNLFELLVRCQKLHRETQGCFDPATGAMTRSWGFFAREGKVPETADRIQAMHNSGFRHLILDAEKQSVKFRKPGLELNFGGIGKGYALDRASALLRQNWGVNSALLHGGSSSIVATGYPAGQPLGWPIAVKHPWNPERILGTLFLRDVALGTSAATFQYFEYNGSRLGHILDPRKGWPAEGVASVSVMAANAADADALSTALFVMGLEESIEFGRTHPEISALILPDSPHAELISINLPSQWATFRPG